MGQALTNQRRAFLHEPRVPFYNVRVITENLPVEETNHNKSLAAVYIAQIRGEQLRVHNAAPSLFNSVAHHFVKLFSRGSAIIYQHIACFAAKHARHASRNLTPPIVVKMVTRVERPPHRKLSL